MVCFVDHEPIRKSSDRGILNRCSPIHLNLANWHRYDGNSVSNRTNGRPFRPRLVVGGRDPARWAGLFERMAPWAGRVDSLQPPRAFESISVRAGILRLDGSRCRSSKNPRAYALVFTHVCRGFYTYSEEHKSLDSILLWRFFQDDALASFGCQAIMGGRFLKTDV